MARSKYSERFCSHCNKTSRMELVGEIQGVQDKMWYRCARCHHVNLITVISADAGMAAVIDPASATPYNPQQSFKIGESIFHYEWNDTGKVLSKTRTSDGGQAIIVSFEKQGQRTLIENLKA